MTPELYLVARQESWRYRVPGYSREDLEQEALVAILEALRTHDPARGPLKPFARFAARRNIQDLLTRSRTSRLGALNESGYAAEDAYLGASTSDESRLEARELTASLHRIQPRLARTIVLLAAGFSYVEIARREGVQPKTVDGRLFQARNALREAA